MKPGARRAALQEILVRFFNSQKPLDHIIRDYFSTRRYAGSKDRRDIADHAFNLFRHWEIIRLRTDNFNPEALLAAYFRYIDHPLFDLDEARPFMAEPLPEWASANVPEFMWKEFQETYGIEALAQAQALNAEGSPDLRVNALKAERAQVLKELESLSLEAVATPYSPWGVRLGKRINLETLNLFKEGWVDVQDEGSQLLALFCNVKPGQRVLDLCAGAGGKTLAFAAMMRNEGEIVATDIEASRLRRMARRLQRAGVGNVTLKNWRLLEKEEPDFDLVMMDAPCSGTGTWRRSPDLRARLTPEVFQNILETQQTLLQKASRYVRQGGILVYATCSVLAKENEQQVSAFLARNPDFCLLKEIRLSPLTHQTDGFYGAKLLRFDNEEETSLCIKTNN